MNITMLQSKLHRATVTEADLDYEGSVTIDRELMDAAGLMLHQKVAIFNITNGERIETYVIEGDYGSGTIQTNGAAAHKIRKGDLVIIVAYCQMTPEAAKAWSPKVVLLGPDNQIKQILHPNA